MKEIVIPLGVMLILTAGATVSIVVAVRVYRTAMAESRAAIQRSAQRMERLDERLAELTTRVALVEQLLRDVG